MSHDDDPHDDRADRRAPRRGLLGRARDLARRVRPRPAPDALPVPAAPADEPRAGLVPAALEAVLGPLVRAVGGRLVDLADFTASRLLELDEAAAELAVFVERITRRHGDGVVVRALLRHNLLLDGTILALLEPALRGGLSAASRAANPLEGADPRAVERGRETLTDLLVVLALLDEHGEDDGLLPSPPPVGTDRLSLLEDVGFDCEFPRVFAWLEGSAGSEADARFIFGSYLIFLETFLLRAMARNLLDLPALVAGGRKPTPRLPGE